MLSWPELQADEMSCYDICPIYGGSLDSVEQKIHRNKSHSVEPAKITVHGDRMSHCDISSLFWPEYSFFL